MKYFILLLLSLSQYILIAQVGINNTDPKAILDITPTSVGSPAVTDGILIPRVNTLNYTPGADQNGMMVYLTATVTVGSTKYDPGFHFWNANDSEWLPIVSTPSKRYFSFRALASAKIAIGDIDNSFGSGPGTTYTLINNKNISAFTELEGTDGIDAYFRVDFTTPLDNTNYGVNALLESTSTRPGSIFTSHDSAFDDDNDCWCTIGDLRTDSFILAIRCTNDNTNEYNLNLLIYELGK